MAEPRKHPRNTPTRKGGGMNYTRVVFVSGSAFTSDPTNENPRTCWTQAGGATAREGAI